jgi:hypothetical protein
VVSILSAEIISPESPSIREIDWFLGEMMIARRTPAIQNVYGCE